MCDLQHSISRVKCHTKTCSPFVIRKRASLLTPLTTKVTCAARLGIELTISKGRAIKRLVVCNNWDLEPLVLINGLFLGCYQPSPEVLIVLNYIHALFFWNIYFLKSPNHMFFLKGRNSLKLENYQWVRQSIIGLTATEIISFKID